MGYLNGHKEVTNSVTSFCVVVSSYLTGTTFRYHIFSDEVTANYLTRRLFFILSRQADTRR